MLCNSVDSVSEASEYDPVPGESLYVQTKVERNRFNSRLNLSQNNPMLSVFVALVLNVSSEKQ